MPVTFCTSSDLDQRGARNQYAQIRISTAFVCSLSLLSPVKCKREHESDGRNTSGLQDRRERSFVRLWNLTAGINMPP